MDKLLDYLAVRFQAVDTIREESMKHLKSNEDYAISYAWTGVYNATTKMQRELINQVTTYQLASELPLQSYDEVYKELKERT